MAALTSSRIYTFNDLDEEVVLSILKFVSFEELWMFEMINQLVGRCCRSEWNQIKSIKCSDPELYVKCVQRCPNLRIYDELSFGNMFGTYNWPIELAEKCPKIETFKGNLRSLVIYVSSLSGETRIKSISFGNSFYLIPGQISCLAAKLNKVKSIEHKGFGHIEASNEFQELLRILGSRVQSIKKLATYEYIYDVFQPGINLKQTDALFNTHELDLLPERHPNLEVMESGVKASEENIRRLNRLEFLKRMTLIFKTGEKEDLLSAFRKFLSCHEYLDDLSIFCGKHLNPDLPLDIVRDVRQLKPDLRSLKLHIARQLLNDDKLIFNRIQMNNLRRFTFIGSQLLTNPIPIETVFRLLHSCPKLNLIIFKPFLNLFQLREQWIAKKELNQHDQKAFNDYLQAHFPRRKVSFSVS